MCSSDLLGADFRRHMEEERERGPRVADGEINHGFDVREIKFATVALIRGGGIVKAVAHDDFAGGEGRADEFADDLRTAGVHQEQLGLGGHRMVVQAVLEGVADFFADGRAAGFAQRADFVAERLQAVGEQLDLRGLAAAFGAFE